MGTYLVGALLLLIIGLAVRKICKDGKKCNGCCGGCGGCSGCELGIKN